MLSRARVSEGTTPADAARKRAAVETYARHEKALRRTARRFSLCADDADEALQRALEILLTKAPTVDSRELIRWTQTVVRHEALAVRRERERILSGPAAATPEPGREDWVALIPADADGPPERAERREAVARGREALQALKPQELRALTLLAEGYSYREIGEITGFSQTKINRCLAEGRERFRKILAGSADGSRCLELRPLLSAFCDGEAGESDAEMLREHLRACGACRATLRAYRAAPAAAAALAPALPLARSLLARLHDALAGGARHFDRAAGDSGLTQAAASGGGGAGIAGVAKTAAICLGTAGGTIACVATGLVPAPAQLGADRAKAPTIERRIDPAIGGAWERAAEGPDEPKPIPSPGPTSVDSESAQEDAAPVAPPTVTSGAVEYEPETEVEPVAAAAPAPSPAPASGVEAADGGNPAGEFGP